MQTLIGKVALVTAASREIGASMAMALASEGASVLISHYGEPERAAATLEKIRAAGGTAESIDADLRQHRACLDLVAAAVARFGRLDILAANAGITVAAPILETTEAQWDTLADLNLKGSFFCAQAAARQMIDQGQGGRIVFSSSVTGNVAAPGLAAYGVTKAALRHMAVCFAAELGRHGITANALGIGAVLNDRNLVDNPDYAADWGRVIPTGRVIMPHDIADALLLLVSDRASQINGHTLMVDGGWSWLGKSP